MDARVFIPHRRPSRRRLPPTLLLAVAILVAACSGAAAVPTTSPSPATPSSTPGSTPSQAPAATATTAAATFPATLTDDEGTSVTIPTEPLRLVSMTPAATDTLFALGLGERVVGKAQDIAPTNPAVATVPDVVTFDGADVEKIASLTPDLVIAGGHNLNRPDDIAKLRSLGIPVLVIYAPDLDGILADIALVGRAVGHIDDATAIAADIRAAFDGVAAAVAGSGPPPRVYAELDATGGYFLPAPDDLLTDMIRIAGGDPLTSGTPGVYQIDPEQIIAFDPQVILLSDTYAVHVEDVAKRAGWSVLSAAKTGDIRPIDASTATRPGPSLARGIRDLALAIHPQLVLPGALAAPPASAAP